jgi:hypothetical protein
MSGFVLLARVLQKNALWRRDPDHLKLFLYLLMNANYMKDETYTYTTGTDKVVVGYAQYLCSYSKISEDCQYSRGNKLVRWGLSRVSRMINALEDEGRIKVLSKTHLGSLIRIENYQSYQDFSTYNRKETGRAAERKRKTSENKVTNEIQIKELWSVYLEELGGKGNHPTLTAKRKEVLGLLYEEQLKGDDNYMDTFRNLLKSVRSSEHHMKERSWHLPESLFRDQERRERWALKGSEQIHKSTAHSVSRTWSIDA